MNDNISRNKINFTLSESAQAHMLRVLPKIADSLSARGLDIAFNCIGRAKVAKEGNGIWEYVGLRFAFGGRKPEERSLELAYDLLGFTVWMLEMDTILLNGRVLTLIKVGSPEPHEALVIENVPGDYLQQLTQGNCAYFSCGDSHGKTSI